MGTTKKREPSILGGSSSFRPSVCVCVLAVPKKRGGWRTSSRGIYLSKSLLLVCTTRGDGPREKTLLLTFRFFTFDPEFFDVRLDAGGFEADAEGGQDQQSDKEDFAGVSLHESAQVK